jgi:predicted NAD/FAD-binding protein
MLNRNIHFYTDAATNIALLAERQKTATFVINPALKRQSLKLTRSDGTKLVLVELRAKYDALVKAIGPDAAHAALASKTPEEITALWAKGFVAYTATPSSSLTVLRTAPYVGSLRRAMSYSHLHISRSGFKTETHNDIF